MLSLPSRRLTLPSRRLGPTHTLPLSLECVGLTLRRLSFRRHGKAGREQLDLRFIVSSYHRTRRSTCRKMVTTYKIIIEDLQYLRLPFLSWCRPAQTPCKAHHHSLRAFQSSRRCVLALSAPTKQRTAEGNTRERRRQSACAACRGEARKPFGRRREAFFGSASHHEGVASFPPFLLFFLHHGTEASARFALGLHYLTTAHAVWPTATATPTLPPTGRRRALKRGAGHG